LSSLGPVRVQGRLHGVIKYEQEHKKKEKYWREGNEKLKRVQGKSKGYEMTHLRYYCFLECPVVSSDNKIPTFQRNPLPPWAIHSVKHPKLAHPVPLHGRLSLWRQQIALKRRYASYR
jgi:hypothetical protein